MWTDASGNWGIGGYWLASLTDAPHEVFSKHFSTRMRPKNIQVKEMFAALHGIRLWLDRLHGFVLTIHCDNQALCSGLTSGSMKGGAMVPLRQIAMLLALHYIIVSVIWIDSS